MPRLLFLVTQTLLREAFNIKMCFPFVGYTSSIKTRAEGRCFFLNLASLLDFVFETLSAWGNDA